jgi:hypothetical protein
MTFVCTIVIPERPYRGYGLTGKTGFPIRAFGNDTHFKTTSNLSRAKLAKNAKKSKTVSGFKDFYP